MMVLMVKRMLLLVCMLWGLLHYAVCNIKLTDTSSIMAVGETAIIKIIINRSTPSIDQVDYSYTYCTILRHSVFFFFEDRMMNNENDFIPSRKYLQ
jgi:hypothetical protein